MATATKPYCKHGCSLTMTNPECPDHGDAKGLRVIMPSGVGVYYVDEDHSYWRMRPDNGKRGTRLTGVTTITKALDIDPEGLMRWAAKTNGIGIGDLVRPVLEQLRAEPGDITLVEGLAWLEDHETLWARLEDAQLTYNDVRDRAGTVGTNVHELAFRALAAGKPVPDYDDLTEAERGWARGVVEFWLDHDPETGLAEQILVDPELGVAGRTDWLGKLRATCTDELCLCHEVVSERGCIDLKTGGYLSAAAHAQVHGYRDLAATSGLGATTWGGLLQVDEGGSYRLIRAEGGVLDFHNAVAAYRSAGAIDREAGKAREARKA